MDRTQLYMSGGFVACSAAVIYLAAQIFDTGAAMQRRKAAEFVPPGYVELEAVVQEVRRNWLPRDKERALERVRIRVVSLQAAMMWVLTRPEHPMFEPTLELTVALPMPEARPLIAAVAMTGPMKRRPKALLAAESLTAWSADELADFLLLGAQPVKTAALEVCATRDDRPVAAILELFEHPDADVRQAALNALPSKLAPGNVRSLMEIADAGGPAGDFALRALARTELNGDIQAALLERLPSSNSAVQAAILDALANREGASPNPQLLWDLVLADGPVDARAKALHCLEKSGAYDPGLVRMELSAMPPKVRYFGARCMLKSGDLEGVEVLLELAAAQEGATETRVAARQLLSELSGRPLHHGIDAWKSWYDEQSSLPEQARTLPAPPF